jgi:hypothetical protein
MAAQNWFFRLADSRFMKAVNRFMLRLPYPLRLGVVVLLCLPLLIIAIFIQGIALEHGIRLGP